MLNRELRGGGCARWPGSVVGSGHQRPQNDLPGSTLAIPHYRLKQRSARLVSHASHRIPVCQPDVPASGRLPHECLNTNEEHSSGTDQTHRGDRPGLVGTFGIIQRSPSLTYPHVTRALVSGGIWLGQQERVAEAHWGAEARRTRGFHAYRLGSVRQDSDTTQDGPATKPATQAAYP